MSRINVTALQNLLLNELIQREGGYVNDPSDSGGETKYGVTKAVARKYGYKGSMKDLTINIAKDIYTKKYWDRLNLDEVAEIAPLTAEELFDTGVNMGTKRAGKFFQRSLNLLTKDNLKVDGDIGPATLRAFNKYINKRGTDGDEVMFKMLNSLQGCFYISLAERRSKDRKFIYGWFKNRVF